MQNTFSREKLQGIPAEIKRSQFEQFVNSFIGDLKATAADGETTYLVNLSPYLQMKLQAQQHRMLQSPHLKVRAMIRQPIEPPQMQIGAAATELIPLFKEKFPDCTITYQEIWTDTDAKTRVLKEGILIDWS
jgi:hypothetical protein